LTKLYLGSYGMDRLEGVDVTGAKGAKGISGASTMNDVDWNAERWWLNQTRKEMEYEARKNSFQKGSSGGSNKNLDNTTPIHDMFLTLKKSNEDKSGSDSSNDGTQSPNNSLSDASPSNSLSHKSTQQQQQVLMQSIEEHLYYMAHQNRTLPSKCAGF